MILTLCSVRSVYKKNVHSIVNILIVIHKLIYFLMLKVFILHEFWTSTVSSLQYTGTDTSWRTSLSRPWRRCPPPSPSWRWRRVSHSPAHHHLLCRAQSSERSAVSAVSAVSALPESSQPVNTLVETLGRALAALWPDSHLLRRDLCIATNWQPATGTRQGKPFESGPSCAPIWASFASNKIDETINW